MATEDEANSEEELEKIARSGVKFVKDIDSLATAVTRSISSVSREASARRIIKGLIAESLKEVRVASKIKSKPDLYDHLAKTIVLTIYRRLHDGL